MNNMKKDYIYSNAKLHYTVVTGNSDTPLVLIHGQCMCGLDYEKVIEKLSEKYTLYLIDCFVHGFLNQTEETNYMVYNIDHGYIFNYLGSKFFGKDWAHKLATEVKEKQKAAPGTIQRLKRFRKILFTDLPI